MKKSNKKFNKKLNEKLNKKSCFPDENKIFIKLFIISLRFHKRDTLISPNRNKIGLNKLKNRSVIK